jgi:hypothetical protein
MRQDPGIPEEDMDLFEIVGFVTVLPVLAGAVVSAMHLGRTRWAPVLLAGFGIQGAIGVLVRVATILVNRSGTGGATNLALLFSIAGLIGFAGDAAVIAGVAGVLQELRSAASRAAKPE